MAGKPRKLSSEFKGKIVVEVPREEKDINTTASEYDLESQSRQEVETGVLRLP